MKHKKMIPVNPILSTLPETMPAGLILVLAKARWCGNCRAYRPVVERAAAARPGARFYEVDVDEREDLGSAWAVDAVPMLFIVQDGKAVDRLVGFQGIRALSAFIDRHLG